MENKRNKRNIKRKCVSRLYQNEEEKSLFKEHVQKYNYISDSDFMRIAVKERMDKDKKTGSV